MLALKTEPQNIISDLSTFMNRFELLTKKWKNRQNFFSVPPRAPSLTDETDSYSKLTNTPKNLQ